jgi:hypothetical protein
MFAYRDRCNAHAAVWNEMSIGINKRAIYSGAVAGVHEAVDPASYAGYMTWVAWLLQRPGKDVILTGWEGYRTPPDARLFVDTDLPLLESINRPDLLNVTVGDYEVTLLQHFDRIEEHSLLSKAWNEGATVVLDSSYNTPAEVQVFATQTTFGNQTLLYVYQPDDLEGMVPVGEWEVPAARSAYYVIVNGDVQPLPPSTVPDTEPLTLEQRVERLELEVFGESLQ